jgi:hypothetical protein
VRQSAIDEWPELGALRATPYDGVAEFLVHDMMDIKRSRLDPYYLDIVVPDEKKFFDVTDTDCTVGWEEVFIEDGKLVPEAEARASSPYANGA